MSVYPARTPSTLNTSPQTAETMIEALLGRETQCAERPIWGWAAVVFREESSKGTGRTLRGKGPGADVRIAAIMSGTAILQQGLTTTCKDPRISFAESDGRSLVGRMSP